MSRKRWGGGGGGEKKKKKYPQRSSKTKHNHPARMNLMLPLGESIVTRRIKLAYMRLLDESDEASLIPKEVADEPPEEEIFARASSDDDDDDDDNDTGSSDHGFRLRTTLEGGC